MINATVFSETIASATSQERLAALVVEPMLPTLLILFFSMLFVFVFVAWLVADSGYGKLAIIVGSAAIVGGVVIVFSTVLPVIPKFTMGLMVGLLG